MLMRSDQFIDNKDQLEAAQAQKASTKGFSLEADDK